MGALVIAAVGAGAGWAAAGTLGVTALTGAQLGWSIGSMLGSSMTKTKVQGAQQQLMDLKVTGTEYGQPIPYTFGTVAVAGQFWWNTDRRATTTTTVTESGGKGGGGTETSTSTITYDMDVLIGLSNNEIDGVSRIWNNGKLIFTASAGAAVGSLAASEDFGGWDRITIYPGSMTQLPDPTYEAAVGATNAPAYRGRAYAFIQGLKLGQSGQVPNLTFEVVTDGTLSYLETWTARVSAADNRWMSVVYGAGLFVAVSDSGTGNRVMTSPDGITWTIRVSAADKGWSGIAYGNGLFVAVANVGPGAGGRVMTSPDGINWTIRVAASDNQWQGVTFGNGLFVAVAANGTTGRVMTSPDGITWTAREAAVNNDWIAVAYGGGLFIATSQSGVGNRVMTSPDGITWTSRTSAADNAWGSIVYGDGLFVAVAQSGVGNRVMTSPDGITWTIRVSAADNVWSGVTYNDGLFIAVAPTAAANGVMSSTDGITWTIRTSAANNSWADVAHGAGLFVAVAYSGVGNRVMTSAMRAEPVYTSVPPDVDDVVSALCLRAGLTAGQIDVTGLSTITRKVNSLAVSQIAATRQPLELLMSTFFFELVVSDKIYFRPRGSASVASIPYLDLGAGGSDDQSEPLALRQMNELEIPAQIALTYININDDYQSDTQYSDRLISAAAGTVSAVQMAIGMTPAEAKAVADTMLLDQAASVIGTKIAVLGDYCRLEPTDPVTVTGADGSTFRLRLVKKLDAYPLLEFEAVLDDVSVLTSQGITSADYTSSTTVAPAVGTLMELMDIPILQDADNDPGFYVATKGDGTPYPGSAVFSSPDNVTYTRKATVLESAVFGSCNTTLGDWTGARVFDEINTVTVNVGDGTLASSTRDLVLNSLSINAMLVGSELIQFKTADLVSAGVYTLSGLLRGGRGTEWAMTGHAAGERCVLLRAEGLRRVAMPNNELGLMRYYKGVTLGRAVSTAEAEHFTDNAVGLKPFSPFDLRVTRDGSNNITFTWQRRSRLTVRTLGALGISVPLGEDVEAYQIDIFASGAYTTVLRTITVSGSPTASYTAAEQTTDGLTPGNPVYARVYQMSSTIGRGYKLEQAA